MKCEVLIDWLTFSVKDAEDPRQVIKDWLGMDPDLFEDPGYGLLGYDKCLVFGKIVVCYVPRQNDHFQNMGICVSMSGDGCRTFETTSKLSSGAESPFAKLFENLSIHYLTTNVSRVDIACDDRGGVLNMDDVIQKTWANDINSRMTKRQVVMALDGKDRSGATVYIGSPSSDFRVRIYDKALEEELPDEHWIRVELVLRGAHAKSFVDLVVNYAAVGQLAAEVLNDKLSFIERDDSNISRCSICSWWSEFVASLEAVRLVSRKVVQHTVYEIDAWIMHQISPSLGIIVKTLGYDHLFELIRQAAPRLTDKQLALIRDFNALRPSFDGFVADRSDIPWTDDQLSLAGM